MGMVLIGILIFVLVEFIGGKWALEQLMRKMIGQFSPARSTSAAKTDAAHDAARALAFSRAEKIKKRNFWTGIFSEFFNIPQNSEKSRDDI